MSILGPAIGYVMGNFLIKVINLNNLSNNILGGQILQIYTDFDVEPSR